MPKLLKQYNTVSMALTRISPKKHLLNINFKNGMQFYTKTVSVKLVSFGFRNGFLQNLKARQLY